MEYKEKKQFHVSQIFNIKQKEKEYYFNLLYDITSNDKNINEKIISRLKRSLKEKTNLILSICVIDFIIDYGTDSINQLITDNEFINIMILISSQEYNIDFEIKYLIQKLKKKYEKNENFINFLYNYNKL